MMKEVTPQLLADYNDQRMFSTTLSLYNLRDTHHGDENLTMIHYEALVAGLMLDQDVDDIIVRLKACRNFDAIVKGDLCREQALALIRRRQHLNEAESLIRCAIEYHHDMPDRQAIGLQALGRLEEARNRPGEAYAVLCNALDAHKSCHWPRDEQWMASTAFHTLRLAIKVGNGSSHYAQQALRIVTRKDLSWKKRWAARVMYYMPGLSGVRLVERFG